ncbi:2-C-methyl-D-erythritol 4-phosphate cytidylyltransferase [Kocuria sp.]|uniref:2-C-methyl-D-erythritol 4-phosphate cytidylyltransferase n=1 Tax=Kocuria sp. TaxID=1871328 RepID=UPI0026DF38EA|nr:2-C-methyl-D-erythritol 4-phosphate cytidylyltransferase [Kocuria sp.]MDO5618047.1 2-C-methyl-D-erythritol 4-phosphate cytidylyltransferase [Kocuria sp.]
MTTANPSSRGGFAVVVVAAGSGTRLGQGMPKALVNVGGRSILEHSLTGIAASGVTRGNHGQPAPVVVTVPEDDTELTAVAQRHNAQVVTGGASRAASVRHALQAVEQMYAARPDALRGVLIHDAARCLTPVEVFHRVVAAVEAGHGAVVPVLPVVDTIRAVDQDGNSQGTVDRSHLRAIQTPQGFDWDLLAEVNRAAGQAHDDRITDDASLVEQFSDTPVHTVTGDEAALKITRPMDLLLAQAILDSQAVPNAQATGESLQQTAPQDQEAL